MQYPLSFEELSKGLDLSTEQILEILNRRRHKCYDNRRFHGDHFCAEAGPHFEHPHSEILQRIDALKEALLYREEERLCNAK